MKNCCICGNKIGTGMFTSLANLSDTICSELSARLSESKSTAQKKLIDQAVIMGANAVIGVVFDISTISDGVLVISANGTAVLIEA